MMQRQSVSCSLSAVQRGMQSAPLFLITRVCLLTLNIITNVSRKNIYFFSYTVQKYKYLGLILEEHLDFKASINELCSKGGRALGACISKFKTLKDEDTLHIKKNDCTVVPIIDYFACVCMGSY